MGVTRIKSAGVEFELQGRQRAPSMTQVRHAVAITRYAHRLLNNLAEPVIAPGFCADAVPDEEQTLRVVFLFDFKQAGVVWPPVRPLPIRLEVVAFRNVGARRR